MATCWVISSGVSTDLAPGSLTPRFSWTAATTRSIRNRLSIQYLEFVSGQTRWVQVLRAYPHHLILMAVEDAGGIDDGVRAGLEARLS